jgi:hypothetical protein
MPDVGFSIARTLLSIDKRAREAAMKERSRNPFRRSTLLRTLIILVGIATGLAAWLASGPEDWKSLGLNLATDLVGAAVIYTLLVLILERTESRESDKERLVAEMGSSVREVAVAAARRLRERGYLGDDALRGADLSRANLRRADLHEANLSDANLSEANLSETNLWEANLHKANLSDANLRGADLRGANLRGANLSEISLGEARYDDTTEWPKDYDPAEGGAVRVESGAEGQ